MALTSKYSCETCDFAIIVENDISPEAALAQAESHVNDNPLHVVCANKMVWTETPYVPQ